MAFFRLPEFHLHRSKLSDWHLGSPSGSGISFGEVLNVTSQSIRIPLSEVVNGELRRQVVLKGDGLGVAIEPSFGTGDLGVVFNWSPKNLPGTRTNTPGVGSRLRYSMFSPDPMEPHHFNGVCWVFALSHTNLGVQASGLLLIFAAEASIYSWLPTSLNASGLAAGIGLESAVVSAGGSGVVYTLKLER